MLQSGMKVMYFLWTQRLAVMEQVGVRADLDLGYLQVDWGHWGSKPELFD